MLKRLWQSVVSSIQGLWRRVWGAPESSASISAQSKDRQPPLDDGGYEFVFMQVLEGVHQGWEGMQVQQYLSRLSDRTTETGWVEWLERFGDRLLENPTSHHQLAARLLKLGKVQSGAIGEKATEVGRALLNKPFTPEPQPMLPEAEALFYQGNDDYQQGQLSQALLSWDRALSLKSDFYQVWTNRGVVLNRLKRYEEALSSYDRALVIKPDYDVAWSNRGVALRNLYRYTEALQSYDRAIALQPDTFDPWLNRGTVLSGFERFEEALDSFEKATEVDPQRYEAWLGKGRMLTLLKRYEEGLEAWDRVIAIQEDVADAWKQRGMCLYFLKRYEEAISSCDRALKLSPEDKETISFWSKSQARLSALAAGKLQEDAE